MLKRLLTVICVITILIILGIFINKFFPADFPDVPGMGEIDPDASKEFITTESGIQYRILRKGNDIKPVRTDEVNITQKQWLSDGHVLENDFEDNTDSGYRVSTSTLPGMREIVQYIGEGGLIEGIFPPSMAFGKRGHKLAKTKNNANLYCLIQLNNVYKGFFNKFPGEKDADAPKEFIKTPNGLEYKIVRKSDGEKPSEGDVLAIHTKISIGDKILLSTYAHGFAEEVDFSSMSQDFKEVFQLLPVGAMV